MSMKFHLASRQPDNILRMLFYIDIIKCIIGK